MKSKPALLWSATLILALGLLFARVVYPELTWLTIALAVLLIGALAALVHENRRALRSRTAAYGLNSAMIAILIIGIVGVVNFLGARYPKKLDLTASQKHSLSDQSVKIAKGIAKPIKGVFFSKMGQREEYKPLLDNYQDLNPKFQVEYVDPDREPTRAKQAGIKKYNTLQLQADARTVLVEEPNEEKLTNQLIKLLKDKAPVLCAITGHGERSFSSDDAEGYQAAKKALGEQSYEVKDVNLVQEGNKVPATCDAIAVLGPSTAFFAPEAKAIADYLEQGGRAAVALDLNLKTNAETAPELLPVLAKWNVKAPLGMVVDPLSRMLGVDASVPILATYSKENAITKDFQNNCYFPFARGLEILPGAPEGLTVQWIAQTTPKSWLVGDLKALSAGQVGYQEGRDKQGPITAAIAVNGKPKGSQAARATRLVVFSTSHFATNNWSRFGGNLDFFLNSVSWLMEDDNLISIRAKEEGPQKLELTAKQSSVILLITVVIVPLLVAIGGIVIWAIRRRW